MRGEQRAKLVSWATCNSAVADLLPELIGYYLRYDSFMTGNKTAKRLSPIHDIQKIFA
jgi:hypothetical protein